MVFTAETLKNVVFMLPNSFDQVAGDAHIKCALRFVGQEIDIGGFHASTTVEVNS